VQRGKANKCKLMSKFNAGLCQQALVKRESEYITVQDPDEETKEDDLSQHQIKITINEEESRMQKR
jgi:hypothetical protein